MYGRTATLKPQQVDNRNHEPQSPNTTRMKYCNILATRNRSKGIQPSHSAHSYTFLKILQTATKSKGFSLSGRFGSFGFNPRSTTTIQDLAIRDEAMQQCNEESTFHSHRFAPSSNSNHAGGASAQVATSQQVIPELTQSVTRSDLVRDPFDRGCIVITTTHDAPELA